MVVDDEEKANILNTFFSTVFTVENEMLATGSVPQDWRIANVVPIFKKGSKSEPGNYRPVSLTSIVGKIFEGFLRDVILDYLNENNCLTPYQHGFMRNRSCQTNLISFYEEVSYRLDHVTSSICQSGCQRCKGKYSSDCCHEQCAAGCTGPKNTDCLACLNFNNSGICELHCPHPTIYNTQTFQTIPNPNARYTFGATCVIKCPYNYLATDVGSCTLFCPQETEETKVGDVQKCEKCDKCAKVCYGLGMDFLKTAHAINSTNIQHFRGCKKIVGNLVFLSESFQRGSDNSTHLTVEDLDDIYTSTHGDELDSLQVFENLRVIWGRLQYNGAYSLVIRNLSISSLGLRSLKVISSGLVLIEGNSKLCFLDTVPWSDLFRNSRQIILMTGNKPQPTCGSQEK
ncbi:unnamed protein product [Ranitomeya imitator]|uniref:receptor protein-tyrosine kinase n=1 Tax=Ranitomeya imitator TaxID=111125 RepID=A0ABN9LIK1_9NEOB|nr:unnamed protein product [Ranitomeya imitator]